MDQHQMSSNVIPRLVRLIRGFFIAGDEKTRRAISCVSQEWRPMLSHIR
jgi:hypothetical protein